jgi:tRNA-dihydrouridine synthase 2
MLARLRNLQIGFTDLLKPLQISTMSGSPIQQSSPRAMKRQKLDHDPQEVATGGAAADHAAQDEASEAELVEREMGLPFEFEKKYENEIDYRNKLVLAPMVRTGSCESTFTF